MSELLLDRAGRRRSPATVPGVHAGRAPRNKGFRYPADPPKVEEIIRHARGRRQCARASAARLDRDPLARRAPHPRSARASRQGRPAPRGRDGCVGLGRAQALARAAARASCRTAVLRHQRSDARPPVVQCRRPGRPPQNRRCRRRPAPFRAAPTPTRPAATAAAWLSVRSEQPLLAFEGEEEEVGHPEGRVVRSE